MKDFDINPDEILALMNKDKEDTVWSIAIEMSHKIYELTGDSALSESYRDRLSTAYYKEQKEAERVRNEELDFFCGRHTFSPWEII